MFYDQSFWSITMSLKSYLVALLLSCIAWAAIAQVFHRIEKTVDTQFARSNTLVMPSSPSASSPTPGTIAGHA